MMRLIRPVFYNEFECIADKCSYSCCAGWNISIDSNTAKEYKTFTGEIGEKVKECVVSEDSSTYHIKLDENKRCPFLRENGLCEIVLKKGPEYLSNTCARFPRRFAFYGDVAEISLSSACPAVTEFMFREEQLSFSEDYIEDIVDIDVNDPSNKHTLFGEEIRKFFIDILRLKDFPFWVKQYFAARLSKKIASRYEKRDYDSVRDEMRIYNNLDYLREYSKSVMAIEPNYILKFKFLCGLYKYFGGAHTETLTKYNDVIKNSVSEIDNLTIKELVAIYEKFNAEVYKDIEYAFENSCVNDLFFKFFSDTKEKCTVYEKCMSVFLLHALIKFTMSVYWYANNYNISRNERIDIISILSRKVLHNNGAIIDFCKAQEEEGLFNPSYLFVIIR